MLSAGTYLDMHGYDLVADANQVADTMVALTVIGVGYHNFIDFNTPNVIFPSSR